MNPNRLVAVLTPLLFAPLAGAVSAWVAVHLPGVDLPADQVQAVFIAGSLIAFGKAAQWLRGWQAHEAREADAAGAAMALDSRTAELEARLAALEDGDDVYEADDGLAVVAER
jgi:hypothetical protein